MRNISRLCLAHSCATKNSRLCLAHLCATKNSRLCPRIYAQLKTRIYALRIHAQLKIASMPAHLCAVSLPPPNDRLPPTDDREMTERRARNLLQTPKTINSASKVQNFLHILQKSSTFAAVNPLSTTIYIR